MILLMEIIYVKKKHKIGKKSWLDEVERRGVGKDGVCLA